jgi:hypothetical protein
MGEEEGAREGQRRKESIGEKKKVEHGGRPLYSYSLGDRSFCPLKDPRLAQLAQPLNAGGDRGVGGVPPTRTIVMNPMHRPSSSGASEVNYYSPPRLGRRGSADRGRDLGPLATHPAR